jgi:hypothetical protein
MRRILESAVALAVITAGCSSPFGPSDLRELAAARRQWEARPFTDYSFETRHDCFFCLPEEVGPVRIIVVQGAISSVTLLETGQPASPSNWYTIEQLYQLIPSFADEEGVEDVLVQYDPILGHPTSVSIRFEEGVLDAGSRYTVSAVSPAP